MKELSGPGRKLIDVIRECLLYRGFSEGEADNMIERIMTYGPDASVEHVWEPILPFGKYRGWSVEDIPTKYLAWLASQGWVADKYRDLYSAILTRLGYGRQG